MPNQRHSQLQNSYNQQTSHQASVTSEDVPSPAPLHAVAGPDTDATTKYDPPPRQQPLDIAPEQGDATTEVPDSEPLPSPPAWRTGDELGLDAAIPVEHGSPLSTTVACTIANGEPIAG